MAKVLAQSTAIVAMKNRVTLWNTPTDDAHRAHQAGQVSLAIAAAVALLGLLVIAPNLFTTGQSLSKLVNTPLLLASMALVVGALFSQTKRKLPQSAGTKQTQIDDEIASQISWSAMRPHINGESRNCKICQRSTASRLLFAPLLSLHYTALALAAMVIGCLMSATLASGLPGPFSNHTIAALDPSVVAFLYLFGVTTLLYIACLLRKPARALEFNKPMGVFWIEKQRVFGWKVGESAQMPLMQIHALQIISYTHRSITEHEINVVFRSGERVNIINHCNGHAIEQDAATLATFLDVPVWNRGPTRP